MIQPLEQKFVLILLTLFNPVSKFLDGHDYHWESVCFFVGNNFKYLASFSWVRKQNWYQELELTNSSLYFIKKCISTYHIFLLDLSIQDCQSENNAPLEFCLSLPFQNPEEILQMKEIEETFIQNIEQ